MKKSNLRTGMVITTREGKKAIVLLNTWKFGDVVQYFPGHGGWNSLLYWNEDLTSIEYSDIVRVEGSEHPAIDAPLFDIWTRPTMHTIRLDDGPAAELSEKTYESMKRSFKFE